MSTSEMNPRYDSFQAFYAFYLKEHSKPITRAMHIAGTGIFLITLVAGLALATPMWVGIGIVSAYTLAWVSHFFLERNRPASFRQPLFSLIADFRMAFEIVSGQRPLREHG